MSKASAQRPSAIFHVIYGFELPATKRLNLSVVCLNLLDSEDKILREFNDLELLMMNIQLGFSAVYWIVVVFVLVKSDKVGGNKEVAENLFLSMLLYVALWNIFMPEEIMDKVISGLFFLAFGICRLAKELAKKNNIQEE